MALLSLTSPVAPEHAVPSWGLMVLCIIAHNCPVGHSRVFAQVFLCTHTENFYVVRVGINGSSALMYIAKEWLDIHYYAKVRKVF